MDETQTIEFKEQFEVKKIRKELGGLLNAQEENKEIELYIGLTDEGVLVDDYKSLDAASSTDLVSAFLNTFEVEHKFEKLENGGFKIIAIANEKIISSDRNIYLRVGTSCLVVDELKYSIILENKKLNMLTLTTIKFVKSDFTKLATAIAKQGVSRTLVDFMVISNMIVSRKEVFYVTSLGMLFANDTIIPGDVLGETIKGNILDLFFLTIEKVKNFIQSEKTLQMDGATRKSLVDMYGEEIYEVSREIITNMLIHSSFKGLMPTPSFKVSTNKHFLTFTNKHVNSNLKKQVEEGHVAHHAHNQKLFDSFRLLYLIEGKGIGFKTFNANKDKLKFVVTQSDIAVSIKRRK